LEILNRAAVLKFGRVRLVGEGFNEVVPAGEAYTRAEDMGLDLILVSDEATPPVVRIQDFKKLEYEKKKAKKAQKQNVSSLKEIQFKINISEHDLQTKVSKINGFLERGDKVKITLRLKGRERENIERAEELVERVTTLAICKANKIPGPVPSAILEPVKAVKPKTASKSSKDDEES
jgi:translation initiation factor IF-3